MRGGRGEIGASLLVGSSLVLNFYAHVRGSAAGLLVLQFVFGSAILGLQKYFYFFWNRGAAWRVMWVGA